MIVPLAISAAPADTAAYPAQIPDSLLLPERTSAAPGLSALGIGVLGAALTAILPQVVGAGNDAGGRRFLVSGAVGLAGILGFLHHGLGQPIPDNLAANAIRRDAWRRQLEDVQRANGLSRAGSELRIQAGAPVRAEGTRR